MSPTLRFSSVDSLLLPHWKDDASPSPSLCLAFPFVPFALPAPQPTRVARMLAAVFPLFCLCACVSHLYIHTVCAATRAHAKPGVSPLGWLGRSSGSPGRAARHGRCLPHTCTTHPPPRSPLEGSGREAPFIPVSRRSFFPPIPPQAGSPPVEQGGGRGSTACPPNTRTLPGAPIYSPASPWPLPRAQAPCVGRVVGVVVGAKMSKAWAVLLTSLPLPLLPLHRLLLLLLLPPLRSQARQVQGQGNNEQPRQATACLLRPRPR